MSFAYIAAMSRPGFETQWPKTETRPKLRKRVSRRPDVSRHVSRYPPLLDRPSWFRVNCLRTDVGLFCSTVHTRDMAPTATCECGAEKQTADHIIMIFCPIIPSSIIFPIFHHHSIISSFFIIHISLLSAAHIIMIFCPISIIPSFRNQLMRRQWPG